MDLNGAESPFMVRVGKKGRVYGPLLVITYLVDIVNILIMEKE